MKKPPKPLKMQRVDIATRSDSTTPDTVPDAFGPWVPCIDTSIRPHDITADRSSTDRPGTWLDVRTRLLLASDMLACGKARNVAGQDSIVEPTLIDLLLVNE